MSKRKIKVSWDGTKLTYDENGHNGDKVHGLKGDQVQWCTDGYRLDLSFYGANYVGHPFDADPGPAGTSCGGCNSAVKVINPALAVYPYSVSLVAKAGEAPHTEDPQVIIDGHAQTGFLGTIVVAATIAIGAAIIFSFCTNSGSPRGRGKPSGF